MYSIDDDNLYDNISKLIKVMYVMVAFATLDALFKMGRNCCLLFYSTFQWSLIYKLLSDLLFLTVTYFMAFKAIPLIRKKIAMFAPQVDYENCFYKYLSKSLVCVSIFVAFKILFQTHRFYRAKDLLTPFESFLEKIEVLEKYERIAHVKRIIEFLVKGRVPAGVCQYIIVSKPANYNLKIGTTYVVIDRISDYKK